MKKCMACNETLIKMHRKPYLVSKIIFRWHKEANINFSHNTLKHYDNLKNKEFDLFKCPRCGFQIFYPPIIGTSSFYDDISKQTESGYYVGNRWEFICALKDLKRNNVKNIFDIGCGSGLFLDYVKDKLPEIERFGYEISDEIAQEASNKGHYVISGKSINIYKFAHNKAFDSITLFQVLEHYANPIKELRRITRKLSKNGILIICVPNSLGPVRFFNNALTDLPPHHITRWTEAAFQYLLPRLGLKIDNIRYEPLPNYLWSSYLPIIIKNSSNIKFIQTITNKTKLIQALIKILRFLRIPWLPGILGHTIYILASKIYNEND